MGLFGSKFGSISNFTKYSGLSDKEEFEKNVNYIKENSEKLTRCSISNLFDIVDSNMDRMLKDSSYSAGKHKVINGQCYDVKKDEFRSIAAAIKSAESKLYRFGDQRNAYILRRFLYHAEELGLPEFKALVLKYKNTFL